MAYRYCYNCGGKLERSSPNLLICKRCDFHFYINPKPANALILENEKGEILLLKRKKQPKKGYWDLPGGFVDLGENIEESVEREIKEELGIHLKEFKYLGSYPDKYFYQGMNFPTLCFVFYGKLRNVQIPSSHEEFSQIAFFPPNKIPFEKIAFNCLKEAIKEYVKKV
ncbi:MAG: NUDIX domain-containing protein [Patescibacteria group bacterium]